MILSIDYMRTNLLILNKNRGLVYIGECLLILRVGIKRTSLVILNIERGLAYLGVSGEIENGQYADQSGYPQHRQRSGLP